MSESKDIQVFEFGGRKVRTAGTFEAPLFCATDVCVALGIEKPENAYARLDDDEKSTLIETRSTGDGKKAGRILYVTESGLFSLIIGSRKPEAKAFKKWVTSEVLPEIRKRGFYSVLAAQEAKQTERLLGEIFPNLPRRAQPIFRELIAALLRLRREPTRSGNPPWARSLASDVYGWAIRVDGQQEYRRQRNPKPNGSHTDHSMFSEVADEHVKQVVHAGAAFARISASWDDWKLKMEMAFGKKALQLPFMVPLLLVPPKPERET